MGNLKYRSIIRFLASGYLIYMGYALFRQLMSEGGVDRPWLIGLFALGFILFGVWLFLFEMRLIKKEQEEANRPEDVVSPLEEAGSMEESQSEETVVQEIASVEKEEENGET